jgi:hypothetical protein
MVIGHLEGARVLRAAAREHMRTAIGEAAAHGHVAGRGHLARDGGQPPALVWLRGMEASRPAV